MENRGSYIELHDQLFDQLRRVNSDLGGEDLKQEIKRSEAMCKISAQLIANGNLMLNYHKRRNAEDIDEIEMFKKEPKKLAHKQ